jgi:hypothetical protein
MTRLTLERRQVWIYLACITAGLVSGGLFPDLGDLFEVWLWPVLGLLLDATFVLAAVSERWIETVVGRDVWRERLAW